MLVCCAVSVPRAITFGSKLLSCFHFSPRASRLLSSERRTRRFCFNPRSMASIKEMAIISELGLPEATLPVNPRCEIDGGRVTFTDDVPPGEVCPVTAVERTAIKRVQVAGNFPGNSVGMVSAGNDPTLIRFSLLVLCVPLNVLANRWAISVNDYLRHVCCPSLTEYAVNCACWRHFLGPNFLQIHWPDT